MEGEAKKENINVVMSPEYLGFYHMYFQLQKHLSWFIEQAHHIKPGAMDAAVDDAYNRIYVQSHFFTPTEGNDEKTALQELETSGAVPQEVFDFKLGSGTKETDFENAIKNFIKSNMFADKSLETFKTTDCNGISEALYESFSKALHITPPKPGDNFTFQGHSFTPRTFVADYLKFDPSAYVELPAPQGAAQGALNLIREAMKKNIAVPIGFDVFEDSFGNSNVFDEAKTTGEFSNKNCPNEKCTQVDGGHEVLGVNWTEDASGNVTALIIKNSWGHRGGRDDRGVKTKDAGDSGFWILEAGYLSDSNPWLFIVPKSMAGRR